MKAATDPLKLFRSLLTQAEKLDLKNPNAMTLCTSTKKGRPSARMVLLKQVDTKGFVFFTNYESKKGKELADNPFVALVFYWEELKKQVRIEGRVEKTTRRESEDYFHTRHLFSQIGAWASKQSSPIRSRSILEKKMRHYESFFLDKEVPLPPHWGGYRVIPSSIEFWIEKPNRLHERFYFRKVKKGWTRKILSP